MQFVFEEQKWLALFILTFETVRKRYKVTIHLVSLEEQKWLVLFIEFRST